MRSLLRGFKGSCSHSSKNSSITFPMAISSHGPSMTQPNSSYSHRQKVHQKESRKQTSLGSSSSTTLRELSILLAFFSKETFLHFQSRYECHFLWSYRIGVYFKPEPADAAVATNGALNEMFPFVFLKSLKKIWRVRDDSS